MDFGKGELAFFCSKFLALCASKETRVESIDGSLFLVNDSGVLAIQHLLCQRNYQEKLFELVQSRKALSSFT